MAKVHRRAGDWLASVTWRYGARLAARHIKPSESETAHDAQAAAFADLQHASAARRISAARVLGERGSVHAAAALKACAHDEDAQVRAAALTALVQIAPDALVPELIKALRHAEPKVVIGAAVVLGHARAHEAVANLIAAFQTEDASVGAAVAWALGKIGDASAVPWLMAAVQHGFALAAASLALGDIGDARAIGVLMRTLAASDPLVRVSAARALGKCAADDADVVTHLTALKTDDDPRVQLAAATALYEIRERVDGG